MAHISATITKYYSDGVIKVEHMITFTTENAINAEHLMADFAAIEPTLPNTGRKWAKVFNDTNNS